MATRVELIEWAVQDLVPRFLWDDRKEDEELPRGAIEAAIESGEINAERIAEMFRIELQRALNDD